MQTLASPAEVLLRRQLGLPAARIDEQGDAVVSE
jgi:hypothetical protein